jgi:hypothetical protein
LDSHEESLWIALEPNTTFYVQVEPQAYSETEYELHIEKHVINDHMEPNDTFSQSKPIDTPGKSVLCNVMTATGHEKGIADVYRFEMFSEKLVRIDVSNAGLKDTGVSTSPTVEITLYQESDSPSSSGTDSQFGDNEGANFEYDLRGLYEASHPGFPAGIWYVEVSVATGTNANAYGTGDGPDCYTDSAGYSLNLELID